MNRALRTLLAFAAIAGCGCQELNPKKPPAEHTVWRQVATWSGHGSYQTESFDMEVLQWRILWRTTDDTASGGGKFKVTVQSAVSGRPLSVAVEHNGAGEGVAYVNDDPRFYFLVIDSAGLDWTVSVEQPLQASK